MEINKIASAILKHSPNMETGILLKILEELDPLPNSFNLMTEEELIASLAEASKVLHTEQVYSDSSRAENPHHLPDCIVFQTPDGWFWQSQMPGCLPDSDPIGPFDTRQDAIDDCQDIG